MALLAVVAAYNEEGLLGPCIRSALAAGVDEVHVFDGAWCAGESGPGFAGARQAGSTDATAAIAEEAGANFHPRRKLWPYQGAKRTAMFHRCGAGRGDHLFVLDADELVTGRFPAELPDGPLNVLLRSVGPNDLPGVRANFPKGDYSATARPALRLFAWTRDLTCICPGYYYTGGRRIVPYQGFRSRLPLVDEVCVEHHANLRSNSRLAHKRAYYVIDHPTRHRRVAAGLGKLAPPTPETNLLTTTVGREPRRGALMAERKIADRRIYGRDARGFQVLVAAPGQPIPDGYEIEERPKPAAAQPKRAVAKRAKRSAKGARNA